MMAWLQAWKKLDASVLQEALAHLDGGEPILLTLCGERHAQTWGLSSSQSGLLGGLKQTLRRWLPSRRPDLPALLKDL
mgnify:FL=1